MSLKSWIEHKLSNLNPTVCLGLGIFLFSLFGIIIGFICLNRSANTVESFDSTETIELQLGHSYNVTSFDVDFSFEVHYLGSSCVELYVSNKAENPFEVLLYQNYSHGPLSNNKGTIVFTSYLKGFLPKGSYRMKVVGTDPLKSKKASRVQPLYTINLFYVRGCSPKEDS